MRIPLSDLENWKAYSQSSKGTSEACYTVFAMLCILDSTSNQIQNDLVKTEWIPNNIIW